MKRNHPSRALWQVLSLLLVLAMLLCACTTGGSTTDTSETIETETETNDNGGAVQTYTITENYMPHEVMDLYKTKLADGESVLTAYDPATAPYTTQDTERLSNGRLLSLTLPIKATGAADENGNFLLTLYIFGNVNETLLQAPVKTIPVTLNKDTYGLAENDEAIDRFLTIDLTSYEIVLATDQTLGLFADTDTLVPGYLAKGADNSELATLFPEGVGFLTMVGTADLTCNNGSLLCDVRYERTYESKDAYLTLTEAEAAYASLLAELKLRYQGKYLSVMGDSISTYGGVTNDPSYNATIADNIVFHPAEAEFPNESVPYWGYLARALDMQLCVPNCYSASRVYGQPNYDYKDSSVLRATELDNDNGTPDDPTDDIAPDVILFYMGINDVRKSLPLGELCDQLVAAEEKDYHDIIDAWMVGLLEKSENGTAITPGENYDDVTEAYALTLYRMKQAYPDAEIYCMNLLLNNDPDKGNTPERIGQMNLCIKALADYFGTGHIDLFGDLNINDNNYHIYSTDTPRSLHPNVAGHANIAELIMEAMAAGKEN